MTTPEADLLINKYADLRNKYRENQTPESLREFRAQQKLCIESFRYLVLMKTARYKNFNNYDDLNQEGLEALLKAMNSFIPGKGSWFWWVHKYIDTRIARCANLHTAIRYPLKYARHTPPHRESSLPAMIDRADNPYEVMEKSEMIQVLKSNVGNLSENQKRVVGMLFDGADGSGQSISKVCETLGLSRPHGIKLVDQVMDILKRNANF